MTSSFSPPGPLQTAVLFLVFNRPDTTARVFEAIRQAKPPRLYVTADGPREGREGEAERVAKVRAIATAVDWPCEVKTLFREKNLGCGLAVSQGITWFFEHEDQGIVLEDDCLPNLSFFWFCEELLEYHKSNENVFMVSGRNELGEWAGDRVASYFYTLGSIWGWASWKRAWKFYDYDLKKFGDEDCEEELATFSNSFPSKSEDVLKGCQRVKLRTVSSWAYQWTYARIIHKGLGIIPNYNLVKNIGFGLDATHTTSVIPNDDLKNEKNIKFPLIHNNDLKIDPQYYNIVYRKENLIVRILKKINKLIQFV